MYKYFYTKRHLDNQGSSLSGVKIIHCFIKRHVNVKVWVLTLDN